MGIPSQTPKHRCKSQEVAAAAPGKQGKVLIKRGGARRDLDLLTLEGVASRLEKWLSMLAASVRQAHRVLPFALEEPRRTGVPQLGAALTDELLAAAALLDTTQKQPGDGEEVKAAMQLLLQHVAGGPAGALPAHGGLQCLAVHLQMAESTAQRCPSSKTSWQETR